MLSIKPYRDRSYHSLYLEFRVFSPTRFLNTKTILHLFYIALQGILSSFSTSCWRCDHQTGCSYLSHRSASLPTRCQQFPWLGNPPFCYRDWHVNSSLSKNDIPWGAIHTVPCPATPKSVHWVHAAFLRVAFLTSGSFTEQNCPVLLFLGSMMSE